MRIIKREIVREVEKTPENIGARISVVKFKDGTYEIAILTKRYVFEDWEIDYSIFPDVFKAETSRDVYGIIQHIIAPAYEKEYGINLYF